MFQDNPLLAQLKQQIKENIPKKEGTIRATEKGFGFLEVDSKTSYFIPPPYMKKCLHGDKVVALIRTEKGKDVAEPDELIEQSLTRFIGRIKMFKGRLNVVPDGPQYKKLSLKAKTAKGVNPTTLAEGDWVVGRLIQHPLSSKSTGSNKNNHSANSKHPDNNRGFFVEISEKITDADDKIAPWWVTLAENNLPNRAPQGAASWVISDDPELQRIEMTDVPFVTIDGASTKDMDDALYAEQLPDGDFKLTIAIADPTAYISPDDEMDKIARQRGFTIYLPGRNIPMLPRELADELCSLVEGSIRPALCCNVTISKEGEIRDDISFFAANIKSHARLNYDEVSDWIEHGHCDTWQPQESIAAVITALSRFAAVRSNWREHHAVVFQDKPDYRFELSDDNDVIAIHADRRRCAHRLVEEAMITANICAGATLKNQFNTGVFNVHSGFKTEKIKEVVELLKQESDIIVSEEKLTTLEGFSELRRRLSQPENPYLNSRLRKLQTMSEISNTPARHFAMGLDIYATWTSPIRKYGDMVNHRLLKAYIMGKAAAQLPDESLGSELATHRKHHKTAERHISDWLYARTLINDPQRETRFNAEVFDINRAGMRVHLIENGATAFIPASLILSDRERMECNNEAGTISIDNTPVYRLGDQLEIVLTEVNLETRGIIAKPTQVFE